MNETDVRPTPEQIHDNIWCSGWGDYQGGDSIQEFRDHLEKYGYVIVHPDDVPAEPDYEDGYESGWNACRAHIFGGDDE